MLLCSMTSLAYDFEVDGIYYNIIDLDSKTVEVTHNGKNNVFFRIVVHSGVTSWLEDFTYYADTYVGEIVVPAKVSYRGREFTVIKIGQAAFLHQDKLTKISIPSSIQEIENPRSFSNHWWIGAFVGCNLQAVQVGNSVCLNRLNYDKNYYDENDSSVINPKKK